MSTLLILQWHHLKPEIFFIRKSSSQKKEIKELVSAGSLHTGAGGRAAGYWVKHSWPGQGHIFHVFRFGLSSTPLVWEEITVTSKTYKILVKQVHSFYSSPDKHSQSSAFDLPVAPLVTVISLTLIQVHLSYSLERYQALTQNTKWEKHKNVLHFCIMRATVLCACYPSRHLTHLQAYKGSAVSIPIFQQRKLRLKWH